MKRISFFTPSRHLLVIATALAFTFSACRPDQVDNIADDEINLAVTESVMEATYDETDDIAMEAMERTDATAEARTWQTEDMFTNGPCVTITHDSVAKTILVDFGTGCLGPDGKTRAGQVFVTYTKRLYHPGAVLTVELIGYSVDSLALEGTKTITNVSPNFQSNITLQKTLAGGKVTWPDGTFATREFTRTSTWVRAARPALDEFHVDGVASIQRRNGNLYSSTVIETLIWKRKCLRLGIGIPAEGTTVIKRNGKPDLTIDFGDGTCDHLVTLSIPGKTKVINVRNL